MKSNFLISEVEVVVRAKLGGVQIQENFWEKNFSQKLLPPPKSFKKRLSNYFLHIFFVKLNFI